MTWKTWLGAVIVAILLAATIYTWGRVISWGTPPKVALAPPEIRAALKYHGILSTYERSDGVWVFERDGQECRLFTLAFLEDYGR
jgi:hypothetical protein